jgi:predicted acylesterase/phospholipase RssA
MPPVVDLILSGGGTRGVAFGGAVEILERHRIGVRRVVGTSAGAIASVFAAAGLSAGDFLKLVPAKATDPFRFNSFFAPPDTAAVREMTRPKTSETRRLLRAAVDGAADAMLTRFAEKRPVIGEAIQQLFAAGKDGFYNAAFESFLNALDDRPVEGPRARLRVTALLYLLEEGGIFDPSRFAPWLVEQLRPAVPGFDAKTTLESFYEHSRRIGREMTVLGTDTTTPQPLFLNHRTAPRLPVVEAVRMSLSVPMVWPEVEWNRSWGRYLNQDLTDHAIVDGAVLSNFPIRHLVRPADADVRAVMGDPAEKPAEVIGLFIDGKRDIPGDAPAPAEEAPKILQRIERLFDTMFSWQYAQLSEFEPLICPIPSKGHPAMEMRTGADVVQRLQTLVNAGRCAMTEHLKKRKWV